MEPRQATAESRAIAAGRPTGGLPREPWFTRADILWLTGIVCLAVTVRALWAAWAVVDPSDGRFDDSLFYHSVGVSLAGGGGYDHPGSHLPTASWPPGYPFFLASLYFVFGTSVIGAKLANVLLGAATCGLLYAVGTCLLDRRSARLGSGLLALFPGQIFFSSLLYSELLFTALFWLGILLVAMIARKGPPAAPLWLVGLGVVLAVAALVREVGLALPAIALLFWGFSGLGWWRALRWTGVTLLIGLALILPWSLRNYLIFDSVVFLSSSTGTNFWQGHSELAHERGVWRLSALNKKYGPFELPKGEATLSTKALRDGLDYMLTHPREEVKLVGWKIRLLYEGDTVGLELNEGGGRKPFMGETVRSVLEFLANGTFFAVLGMSAVAVLHWFRLRNPGPLLLFLVIVMLTAGYVLFFAAPRFHFPIVPAFCLLAAWGVINTLVALPSPARRRAHHCP